MARTEQSLRGPPDSRTLRPEYCGISRVTLSLGTMLLWPAEDVDRLDKWSRDGRWVGDSCGVGVIPSDQALSRLMYKEAEFPAYIGTLIW